MSHAVMLFTRRIDIIFLATNCAAYIKRMVLVEKKSCLPSVVAERATYLTDVLREPQDREK